MKHATAALHAKGHVWFARESHLFFAPSACFPPGQRFGIVSVGMPPKQVVSRFPNEPGAGGPTVVLSPRLILFWLVVKQNQGKPKLQ